MNSTSPISADTLVTGATGFLGRWLVAALTRDGRRVACLVRSAAARGPELAAFVDAHGGNSALLTVLEGDLAKDNLGLSEELVGIRDVFHLAAVFAFGMTRAEAKEVNVRGTLRVAEWASRQANLRRVIHLAGYRATVLPDWLPQDAYPLAKSVDARLYKRLGAYEASKLESYIAMKRYCEERALPYTAVHPSSVIGHSTTGETSQLTGIGEIVQKLWTGALPAMAGTPKTNVPLIAVDFLADFLASVPTREETVGEDLCVLDPETPLLPDLIALIAEHLGVRAPKRFVSTKVLARLPKALTGVEPESLSFLTEDVYDTRSADAHACAVGLVKPDIRENIRRWCDDLIARDFGAGASRERGRFSAICESQSYSVGPNDAEYLLLHGLPFDSESMRPLASALAAPTRRFDLPGLGRSSQAREDDAMWLDAILGASDAPVALIGHSYGAGLALAAAERAPERVRELILISPFFLQERAGWPLRRPWLTARLLRSGDRHALQARTTRLSGEVHDAVASAHVALQRRGVARAVAERLATVSTHKARAKLVTALESVTVPTLLIHGECDPIGDVPSHVAVHCIADAGHTPQLEKPTDVARAIHEWQRQRVQRRTIAQSG